MEISNIIIVQFRTDQSLIHEQKCIKSHIDKYINIEFINLLEKTDIENLLNKIKTKKYGVIIGGSGEFSVINKNNPKEFQELVGEALVNLSKIIEIVFDYEIPTLGICFGHQAMAEFNNADVVNDETQMEAGVFKVTLDKNHNKDPLLTGLPDEFNTVIGHKDSVINLPKFYKILGSSERCPTQIIKYTNNIYSTQFHPELNNDDLEERLNLYPEYREDDSTHKHIKVNNLVTKILDNFVNIILLKK